jgi:hypothetical protein
MHDYRFFFVVVVIPVNVFLCVTKNKSQNDTSVLVYNFVFFESSKNKISMERIHRQTITRFKIGEIIICFI